MNPGTDPRERDLAKLRELVGRILRSGGTDLAANEELEFFQDHGDPFLVTETAGAEADQALLRQAFEVERDAFIGEQLADGRITPEEAIQRRSSMFAVEGSTLNLETILGESKAMIDGASDDS